MYMARLAVFRFCLIVVVAVGSVCYPLFGPLNVTDFGLPLGQFGRARTTTYAGWMCLNKYAKFATFVRAAAAAFFFLCFCCFIAVVTVVAGFGSAGSAGFVFPPFRRHFC